MLKEFDDWGMIRRETGKFEASVRRPLSDEAMQQARTNNIDPLEPLSLALIHTLEKIKDKESFLLGIELAALTTRSHRNRQTQILQSPDAADWEKVEAKAAYNAAGTIEVHIRELVSLAGNNIND
jgi:hypothetical protein